MSLDGVRLASLGTKFAESRGVTCSSLAVDFVCERMNGAGRGGSSLLCIGEPLCDSAHLSVLAARKSLGASLAL